MTRTKECSSCSKTDDLHLVVGGFPPGPKRGPGRLFLYCPRCRGGEGPGREYCVSIPLEVVNEGVLLGLYLNGYTEHPPEGPVSEIFGRPRPALVDAIDAVLAGKLRNRQQEAVEPPIPQSYWVQPGLLAGHYPGALTEDAARDKVTRLLDAGMSFFMDLTCEGELEPYARILEELGAGRNLEVTHQRMSIKDAGTPTAETMRRILDAMDAAMDDGQNIYVHCWGGHGRTGVVVGCHLVRHGMDGEAALARIAALHENTPRGAQPSPETRPQCDMVRNWKEQEA